MSEDGAYYGKKRMRRGNKGILEGGEPQFQMEWLDPLRR